jgi:hypothetical protein
MKDLERINWETRGKSIKELIHDLSSFEDQSLQVTISTDGAHTKFPISLVGKIDGECVLFFVDPDEA